MPGMDITEKIAWKERLKIFCRQQIEQRMAAAKKAAGDAQESANSEEKSSAGDKYETGRAMGHLQKDMHARQLSEHVKELAALQSVNTGILYDHACAGACIVTEHQLFFIAAGLGRQQAEGKEVIFLSPHAPLAAILQNKKQGDSFIFNRATVVITQVF